MVRTRTAIAVAIVALIGAGGGAGAFAAATGNAKTTTVVVDRAAAEATLAAPENLSIAQIYRRTYQGVVEITGTETASQSTPFGALKQKETVEGSGFVYDKTGHVVTNYHVVEGAHAHSIKVLFPDGSTYEATVAGYDASTDLAVLQVDAPASELHPLTLGDSSRVQVGDGVVAIGSPFGLPETVTSGIVSALNRTIGSDNAYSISGAIQTDAPINHGNSGGPLLNGQGQVIGINSQIESEGGGSDGVGFAISSSTIRSVVTQLLNTGKVEHAYLGVAVETRSIGAGAHVTSVKRGSPAATAGLKAGDVIKTFAGRKIASADDFIAAVSARKPGDEVTATYVRHGKTETVQIRLGTRGS
jgi:putative serine protease PepD